MKNRGALFAFALCFAFLSFSAGFFIGRNFNHTPIQLEKLSTLPPKTNDDNTAAPSTPSEPKGPININTADAEQLRQLPGIGETLARRIVEYRNANGLFDSIGALANVEGIGASRLEAIMDYITVGG